MNYLKNIGIHLLLMMLLSFYAVGQNSHLYSESYTKLNLEQAEIVSNNLKLPIVKINKVVFIDRSVFQNSSITVDLFDNQTVTFYRKNLEKSGIGFRHWTGQSKDGTGSAAFLINGNRISGHFSGNFGNFEIYPLGKGLHILAALDNTKFGSCGNEELETDRENSLPEPVPIDKIGNNGSEKSASGTECFIRLLVAYTQRARTNTGSQLGRTMNEHISLAVLESNLGYANSNVEMRVELAYSYQTDDDETSNISDDVDDLQSSSDGKWDEIHDFRNFYDGDMVCLVTDGTYSGLCGRAFGFNYTNDANMFQISEFNCIVGNFTFAHEFGHNQGCRHDNDNTGTPFSYARGYKYEGNNISFRTIMAVADSDVNRFNLWSNPGIDFPGTNLAVGTSSRDNARALDVGDFTVAHHRTTAFSFSTSNTVEVDELLNMVTTSTLNASNAVQNDGRLELKSRSRVILQPGFHAITGSSVRAHITDPCNASYAFDGNEDEVESRTEETNHSYPDFDIQVFPNPFIESATIQWQSAKSQQTSVLLMNAYGQVVQEIMTPQLLPEGQHSATFQGKDLVSGLYQVVLKVGSQVISKPVVYIRN